MIEMQSIQYNPYNINFSITSIEERSKLYESQKMIIFQ